MHRAGAAFMWNSRGDTGSQSAGQPLTRWVGKAWPQQHSAEHLQCAGGQAAVQAAKALGGGAACDVLELPKRVALALWVWEGEPGRELDESMCSAGTYTSDRASH